MRRSGTPAAPIERVAVWGGVWHPLKSEKITGPETRCGLQLRDVMTRGEAEEHGLVLCRFCGEDRG